MNDPWSSWLDDNFKYVMMAYLPNESDRNYMFELASICKKHGVSFRAFVDIIGEFDRMINNDKA